MTTRNTYANTYTTRKRLASMPLRRFFQGNPNGHTLPNVAPQRRGKLSCTDRKVYRICRQSRIETLTQTLTRPPAGICPNGASVATAFRLSRPLPWGGGW